MARVKGVGRLLGMWVNIFVSAPISALVPILMAVVGIGETTVVVTVFLFAVFVIMLDTQVGITHADRSLVEMARSFGASRGQLYTKVLLLSALPEILAGVRLGAIRGVKGVVIGQLLVAIIGVGELFEIYSQQLPDGRVLGAGGDRVPLRLRRLRGDRLPRAPRRVLRRQPLENGVRTLFAEKGPDPFTSDFATASIRRRPCPVASIGLAPEISSS